MPRSIYKLYSYDKPYIIRVLFKITRSAEIDPGFIPDSFPGLKSGVKMKSQFEKLGKTYSFAIGREKSPERHYLYHKSKEKVPGPGTVSHH